MFVENAKRNSVCFHLALDNICFSFRAGGFYQIIDFSLLLTIVYLYHQAFELVREEKQRFIKYSIIH